MAKEDCTDCKNKVNHAEGVWWDCSVASSDKENILIITIGRLGNCPYYKSKNED